MKMKKKSLSHLEETVKLTGIQRQRRPNKGKKKKKLHQNCHAAQLFNYISPAGALLAVESFSIGLQAAWYGVADAEAEMKPSLLAYH